jgi:predicted enzyme related to lactoylglutathione lyase
MVVRLSHIFMIVSNVEPRSGCWWTSWDSNFSFKRRGTSASAATADSTSAWSREPSVGDDVEINIEVDDVDAAYGRLIEAGAEVEGPPEQQEWGARHLWFRDVDGRRMSLFTP